MHVTVPYESSTNLMFVTNSAYGTDVTIAPEVKTEGNIAYDHNICGRQGETTAIITMDNIDSDISCHLQAVDSVIQNEDENDQIADQLSTTDVTSTTYTASLPCPIVMNLPGTKLETLM